MAVVAARGSRRLGEMLLRFSVFGYIEIRNFFIIYGEEVGGQERINLLGRMEMHHREGLLRQFEVTDYEEEKPSEL